MPKVLAIRHVAFEDLDGYTACFRRRGFDISYRDAWYDNILETDHADVLALLGAPIGVYEADLYPFIRTELNIIESWIKAGKPVLGICFGAQLLANVLGSTIRKSEAFEFGWKPIQLTSAGQSSPIAPYGGENVNVFHCHGDTFDVPRCAQHLASSNLFESQAFSYGPHLGIQFHGEVTSRGLTRWYIGHSARIKALTGVRQLQRQTAECAPTAELILDSIIGAWLNSHKVVT